MSLNSFTIAVRELLNGGLLELDISAAPDLHWCVE